ncbi:MAG: fibronectin type III domain-containing protein [Candidatus Latescibacteria bacterium]|nr:fibronectin type III domain-containing protein [Candidatus Latescibacterota bacterium]
MFQMPAVRLKEGIIAVLILSLGVVTCHKAERNNPFDPALTPAIDLLSVIVDETMGTATLTWTPYQGDQPFAAYRVLRNEAERTVVDTVKVITEVNQTSFVDADLKPNTDYVYRVSVVNTNGFAVPSQAQRVRGYEVRPVQLLDVSVNLQEKVVVVRWSQFRGAKFTAYRVERLSASEEDFTTVTRLSAVGDTVFVDRDPPPDLRVIYRIVMEAAGQEWVSNLISRISPASVRLLAAEERPQEGGVVIRWSRFQGGEFEAYRVERRGEHEGTFVMVTRLSAVDDTVFVDTDLLPDVTFVYQIVVEASGQVWASNRSQGVSVALAPVRLLAAMVDEQEGTVRLTWSRFVGPGFTRYQLHRRVVGEQKLEILGTWTTLGDTAFVDQQALSGVEYVYRVLVEASGWVLYSNDFRQRWTLPSITLFDSGSSETATARLTWTQYRGPRFQVYRVLRRVVRSSLDTTVVEAPHVIAEIPDITQTLFVESGLIGGFDYFYKVVAVTGRGEEVASNEAGEEFFFNEPALFIHRGGGLIDLPEIEAGDYGRLYVEPDPRTAQRGTLLLAGADRVRLSYYTGGTALERQVLVQNVHLPIAPRSVATALTPDGTRFLSMALGKLLTVLTFGQDGLPFSETEQVLFPQAFPERLNDDERILPAEVVLWTPPVVSGGSAAFDNVTVTQGGRPLFEETFEDGNANAWEITNAVFEGGRVTTVQRGTGGSLVRKTFGG